MVQGFNQYAAAINSQRANRCSGRRTRPPSPFPPHFPPYLDNNFTEENYNFTDINGNNFQGLRGDRMEVTLLPGAFQEPGTAPGSNELEPITSFLRNHYPIHQFIKGHMWNQEIGGKGVTKNLVPLTSQANSAHKNNAETPLKEALRQFGTFYQLNNSNHPDYAKVYGFEYVVETENDYWQIVTELIVPNSIHVQVFPGKYPDAQGNFSRDNSIINNAITNQGLRDNINRLVNGIWIDQNGVVTDA